MWPMIWWMMEKVVVAVERALRSVSSWYSTTPAEKMIGAGVDRRGRCTCSGAMYLSVPTIAALRARGLAGVLDAGHAKVRELDAATGLEEQVGRLDVAVHDGLAMCA
jgi:hypothetical protein